MSSKGAERLGQFVRERREALDLNQLEVHAAGGPSNSWQTLIENGRLDTLSRLTARKLDRGLRWEPGSARRVWEGGEPTPRGSEYVASPEARVRALNLPADQERAVLEIVRELLPPPRDLGESVRQRLTERGLAEHFNAEANDDNPASGSA